MLNSYNKNKNIFIPSCSNTEDISGKITSTNILETIPKDSYETPLKDWKSTNNTREWRWRFLEFNNKSTIEMSFLNKNSNNRQYFTKSGNWVTKSIPAVYDDYVVKQFFYYSEN